MVVLCVVVCFGDDSGLVVLELTFRSRPFVSFVSGQSYCCGERSLARPRGSQSDDSFVFVLIHYWPKA